MPNRNRHSNLVICSIIDTISLIRFRLALLAALLLAALASTPAPALTLVPIFVDAQGETWDASRQQVVLAAMAQWEASILDSNTVAIQFGYADLGTGGVLGRSGSSIFAFAGDDIFPVSQGGCPTPTAPGNPCAAHNIDFNSAAIGSLFFDTTLGTSGDIPAGQFDAYSIALHEIGHALGFLSGAWFNAFDTESQSDKWGVHITGTTFDPEGLDVMLAAADDLSHLPNSTGDLMATTITNGERRQIGHTDLLMLSIAYGYSIAPEPQSWMLVLIGLAGLGARRRRRASPRPGNGTGA